jgi:short-subunit dehydrogenase involved in D-alanine esterification of teichoic acids
MTILEDLCGVTGKTVLVTGGGRGIGGLDRRRFCQGGRCALPCL